MKEKKQTILTDISEERIEEKTTEIRRNQKHPQKKQAVQTTVKNSVQKEKVTNNKKKNAKKKQ